KAYEESYKSGEYYTLSETFSKIPEEVIFSRPRLAIYYLFFLQLTLKLKEQEYLFERYEKVLLQKSGDEDDFSTESHLLILKANFAISSGRYKDVLRFSQKALEKAKDNDISAKTKAY